MQLRRIMVRAMLLCGIVLCGMRLCEIYLYVSDRRVRVLLQPHLGHSNGAVLEDTNRR